MRQRITWTEFLEWLEFLDQEKKRHTKQDHYLAQIAAEIRRWKIKNPNSTKVTDMLLKFATPDEQERMALSKAVWLAAVNLQPGKN